MPQRTPRTSQTIMRNIIRAVLVIALFANAHAANWSSYTNDWICPIVTRALLCGMEATFESALGDLPDIGCVNGQYTTDDLNALGNANNQSSVLYMTATVPEFNNPKNTCEGITSKTGCEADSNCEYGSTAASCSQDCCFLDHEKTATLLAADGAPTSVQAYFSLSNDKTCHRLATEAACNIETFCRWADDMGECSMTWAGYSDALSMCQVAVDFLAPVVTFEASMSAAPALVSIFWVILAWTAAVLLTM